MAIFDGSDLTLNREDIKFVNEALFEAFQNKLSLNDFCVLQTGIKHNKQLLIMGIFEGITGKLLSDCAPTPNDNGVAGSEKTWTPKYIGDRFSECFADLMDTFWKYSLKSGVEKADLTATDFAAFIDAVYGDAIEEAIHRMIWFNDTDAANYNDSPAGVIINSIDPAYFTPFDGFWKQIYDIVSGDSSRKSVYVVSGDSSSIATKNAGASYAAQAFSATDITNQLITNTLRKVSQDADTRMSMSKTVPMFIVTKSVADQYINERLADTGIELAYTRTESGIKKLSCMGYDLLVNESWDRNIRAYENNGTKYYLPHRILFVQKPNLIVGTEEEKNFKELDMFHDKKDKTLYLDWAVTLDAKIGLNYGIQVAY